MYSNKIEKMKIKLECSQHFNKRIKERNINYDKMLANIRKYFKSVKYNIHTKTLFFDCPSYLVLVRNKILVTIYHKDEITRQKRIFLNLYSPKSYTKKCLKKYFFSNITLNEFRAIRNDHIILNPTEK